MASLTLKTGGVQLAVRLIKNRFFAATGPEIKGPAIYGEKYLKRLLWYLLGGTRGGPTRAEILKTLRDRPLNANQLAEALRVD